MPTHQLFFNSKMSQVYLYAFCEGCGVEVDSSSYPEKSSLCFPCEEERQTAVKLNTIRPDYLALSPQASNKMSSTQTITPEQIKLHRSIRKTAGLVGCKDGSDYPSQSLKGISWRPADPMNPSCFCHDCRETWDPEASIDLQLLKDGNKRAVATYASLLSAEQQPPLPYRSNGSSGVEMLPTRSMTHHSEPHPRPPPIYISLRRDVLNEMPNERLKRDLAELRGNLQSELVRVMDKKRIAAFSEESHRSEFFHYVDEEEHKIWKKLEAVELLLKD
jgi:hypothetical protein